MLLRTSSAGETARPRIGPAVNDTEARAATRFAARVEALGGYPTIVRCASTAAPMIASSSLFVTTSNALPWSGLIVTMS